MKRNLLLALALLVPIVIAGCIASGTIVLVFDVNDISSSDDTVGSQFIDLNENDDYSDNKDKLKSVDAITLTGYVINYTDHDLIGEAWISDSQYSDTTSIRQNATRIFTSPTISANDSLFLDWADGMSHIENFDYLVNELETDGTFYLYGISSGSFDLKYDLNLVITITAGL
jgi:hypothetical protein